MKLLFAGGIEAELDVKLRWHCEIELLEDDLNELTALFLEQVYGPAYGDQAIAVVEQMAKKMKALPIIEPEELPKIEEEVVY